MKKRNQLLSLFLAMVMLIATVPVSEINSSASYSGAFAFDSAGDFTVIQISDIQDNADVDNTVIAMITKAINRYSPDLVIFTGDNTAGRILESSFESSVDEFLQPLLNTGTKFAVTFGNHDAQSPSPSKDDQYDYFISHGGSCAVDFDVDYLTGAGSGVIPIYPYGKTSGTPAFQLYPMDSGDGASSGYDSCYTNQIDYYIQRSQSYPTVPSLWFMHIPVCDYYTKGMTTVPSGTANSFTGNGSPWSSNAWILTPSLIDWSKSGGTSLSEIYKEAPCPANQSTYESTAHRSSAAYGSLTNYQAWVNYGNMLGCYVGHDHQNSFVVTTEDGIDLGYSKSATLNSYNDGNPGLRVFNLKSDGSYTTKSVTNNDLSYPVGDYTAVNNAISAARFIDSGTTYFRANNINDPNYYNASSSTIGTGIYAASDFTDNAEVLRNAINNVIFGLDTRSQSIIDAYAASVSHAWQALSLKSADYSSVNTNLAYTDGTNILAPPFYSATHSGKWLPRGAYTSASLAVWDAACNAVVTGLKVPSQTTVNGYASALSSAYQSLRLRTDISYTIEYECNGVKIVADKIVTGMMAGTTVTETYKTIPSFIYLPDPGDVNGTKSMTLGLTDNVLTFNYSGNINVTYKVQHYEQNLALNGYTLFQTETIGGTINTVVNGVPLSHSGFAYNSGIAGTVASGTVAGDGSLTLKLYYARNSYNVTFSANGGTGSTSASMMYGSALSAPNVIKTGYSLNGWSPTLPSTVPASDVTYTAQWNTNSYLITFEADGGTGGSSGNMQYGATLNAPDLYRAGYTFKGWNPLVPPNVPAINTIYTALWDRNNYQITFDANDGVGGSVTTMPYGANLVPPDVMREDYDFVCWFPDVPSTVPAYNAIYTAIWGLKTFTITFDANGGTGGGSMQTLITGEILLAPEVLRTGWTFKGWDPVLPERVPAENAVYKAQWERNYYTMIFDAGGGVGGCTNVIGFGEKMVPPEVSKPGYVFAGWTPEVPDIVPAENITFTAHWSLLENLITFDANGGIGSTSGLMAFGATLIPPNVIRTGYTLTGWTPSLPPTVPAAETTYKANWQINKYNITFDANGGTGGFTGSYDYNAALSAPGVYKTGFTFSGWVPEVPGNVPAADSVYTAQWVPTNYTVTFDADGGEGGISGTLMPYGAVLKAPVVYKTGYTFTEWTPQVPISVPAGNVIYKAGWTINSYLIVFDANGGTGGTSGTFTFNTPLSVPTVVRTGYTLTGWEPELTSNVPAANTTYKAKWSQDHYSVIFDADGGEGGTSGSFVYGEALLAPLVSKTGYTFNGWSPSVPSTVPVGNATYKAQWKVNSYTLVFNANGGTGGTSGSVVFGAAITAPEVKRTGYTLTGWSQDVPQTMPAYPLQLNAQWEINKYDVVFLNGVNEISRISTAYDSAILKPADPEKAGCIFLGWYPAVPSAMPDQAQIFTAEWYTISFTVSFDLNGGTGAVPPQQEIVVGNYVNLPAQGDIVKTGLDFLGWSVNSKATVPIQSYLVAEENITLYAVWGVKHIAIEKKDGSTAVIGTSNNFIYGLETGLTQEVFENNYIQISGNARLVYTPSAGGFGTGTKVELVDNKTNDVVNTYYIIIFGDVNGDGIVDLNDACAILNHINNTFPWDQPDDMCYIFAGDFDKNGNASASDIDVIINVQNYYMYIDQVSGTAISS